MSASDTTVDEAATIVAQSASEDMPEPAKAKRSLQPLRGLLPFLKPYGKVIGLALVALILAAVATLAMPVAIRRVIDLAINASNADHIDQHFLALLLLAAIMAVFSSLRFYLVSWIGERVVADLRSAVFRHILSLTPSFFEVTRSGEILSRLTTDTTLIQNVVGSSLSIALRSAVTLFGGLIMLAFTSIKLTAIILLLLPLVVLPIFLIGRRIRHLSRASQDRIADTSAVAGEIIGAMPIVQAFTLEKLKQQRFDDAVEASFTTAKKRISTRAVLTGVAMVAVFVCIVAVLWIGTLDVLDGRMSGGELGQFLLYAIIVGGSSTMLGEIWGSLQQAAGATERLMELLHTQSDITVPTHPVPLITPGSGLLEFDQVSFNYPSRPDQLALKSFNLSVKPGETIALVGPSGAGKTTVFQLLLNFYLPQSGRVLLDGVDIARANPLEVRERFAIVPQETVLFAASILENIRYGRPQASDAEVVNAAKEASAHEFVEQLSEGYDTFIGERGVRLSGGQQQRLAIARAILRAPQILLLDEATSALDSESELLVQQGVDRLMGQCTTIAIAHRLSTVVKADRIVVMDQGVIVAEGTHQQLLNQNGLYARLAELQLTKNDHDVSTEKPEA